MGDFTPTLQDGNPTTHLLLFGEINAIRVELGEADLTKVKHLTKTVSLEVTKEMDLSIMAKLI